MKLPEPRSVKNKAFPLHHDTPPAIMARMAHVLRLAVANPDCPADLAADCAWQAQANEAAAAGVDPRQAFGLYRAPGKRTEATTARTRQRNALLRRAYEDHFAGMGVSKAADTILTLAKRCERRAAPPKPGSPEACIIEAAKLAPIPGTPRMLRTILQTRKERGK